MMDVEECVAVFDTIRDEPETRMEELVKARVGEAVSPVRASRTSVRAAASKASKMMDKAMTLKVSKTLQGITSKPISRSM